jgi:hypothetical protein
MKLKSLRFAVLEFAAATLLTLYVSCAHAAVMVVGEPRNFVFEPRGHFADRPIKVHYYVPKSATSDSQLLFIIHGSDRDAGRELNHWIVAAERHGFIAVAPQFDEAHFPVRLFQLGGIESHDPAGWSFQIIENLFDQICRDQSLTAKTYLLFGHSAGAQFVHRMMLMMDRPRASTAVAANAGTYTFPVYRASFFDARFPWKLDESALDRARLKEALGRKLVILLGEEDVRTDGEFPGSREAMEQGSNRLERGRNFCDAAKTQAGELGVDLHWKCVTVPKVGHSAARMSKVAEKVFFEGSEFQRTGASPVR